jgi:hypothetical protein
LRRRRQTVDLISQVTGEQIEPQRLEEEVESQR